MAAKVLCEPPSNSRLNTQREAGRARHPWWQLHHLRLPAARWQRQGQTNRSEGAPLPPTHCTPGHGGCAFASALWDLCRYTELAILPDVTDSAFKREAALRILGDSSLRPPVFSSPGLCPLLKSGQSHWDILYPGNFFPKSTKPFRCAERGTVQWDFRLPGAQFKEIWLIHLRLP